MSDNAFESTGLYPSTVPWEDDAFFKSVVQHISEHAIVMIDAEGIIRSWNIGAEHIFGYPVHEALGMPIQELYTGADRAAGIPEREMAGARESGKSADERWQMRKTGELIFASGTVVPIWRSDGGLCGFTKILRDDTRRKRLEDELAATNERLNHAQAISRMGTFEWDLQTDRETWTDGMYRLYEIPSGTVVATYPDWIQRVHAEDRERVEKAFAEGIAFHRPIAVDFRILVPEGERWVACRCAARYGEQGKPLALSGTQVDITERKRSEAALERLNRDLQQFAYVASHDLQEPLRMVRAYMGLLKRGYAASLDERANDFMRFAIDGAERMQRMISSLLELANLESGGLHLAPCEAKHAVVEAIDNLGKAVDAGAATIDVGELPLVLGDCDHLVRVFQNLIANAVKYRRPDVPPVIVIGAERRAHEWIFSIGDNGIGIPPEHSERVFDLFKRANANVNVPGSGIGLSICRKIVELHGGRIWVESKPGEGSIFKFTLPAVDAPA